MIAGRHGPQSPRLLAPLRGSIIGDKLLPRFQGNAMIRRFAMTGRAAGVLLALMASLAAAAVLKLVPESAWGVAVVNRLADLDARLQALGKEMQLPVPSFLDRVKQMNMTNSSR